MYIVHKFVHKYKDGYQWDASFRPIRPWTICRDCGGLLEMNGWTFLWGSKLIYCVVNHLSVS
jgi:hypothetical protein